MLPDYLLITFSLIVPIGLTACIFILLKSHKTQETRLHELEQEKNSSQEAINLQLEQVLKNAQNEAIKIISEANENAKTVLLQAQVAKGQSIEETQKNLEALKTQQQEAFTKATKDLTDSFQNSINKLQTEDINLVKKLTKDIEDSITYEVGDFKSVLEQETISSQKIVGQKIEEEYKETQSDVEQYKKEELQKVDEKIEELIRETTEKVLHKTLSLNDHYDLVEQALNEAKDHLNLTSPLKEEEEKEIKEIKTEEKKVPETKPDTNKQLKVTNPTPTNTNSPVSP